MDTVHSGMRIGIVVAAVLLVLLVCLGVARWASVRAIQEDLPDLDDAHEADAPVTAPDARPELPQGHRPPAGLGPISPSERFLAAEAERGLRDLQEYLLDAA